MRHYRRGSFEIEIHTEIRCSFPAYLKSALGPAVRAALDVIPDTVFKKMMKAPFPHALHVSVVSPRAIRSLNRDWRKKDKVTDVLSFSRLEGESIPSPFPEVGDVLICWERAKSQRKEFGTTTKGELQRLVVHGVLHLFGYDHETGAREAKKMFGLQEKALKAL